MRYLWSLPALCLSVSCVSTLAHESETEAWESIPTPAAMGRLAYPFCFTTGETLHIFGGIDEETTVPFNSRGFRYDWLEGRWTPWAAAGRPPPKWNAAQTYTEDSFFVIGGSEEERPLGSRDAFRYRLHEGRWELLPLASPLPTTQRGTLTAIGRGLYLYGGKTPEGETLDLRELSEGQRIPLPKDLGQRVSHIALSWKENLVIWGGFQDGARRGDGYLYDTKNGVWRPIAPTPLLTARANAQAFIFEDRLYIFGGVSDTGADFTAAVYDLKAESWSALEGMEHFPLRDLKDFSLARLPNGDALVYGGRQAKTLSYNAEIYLYSLRERLWRRLSNPGAPPGAIAACIAVNANRLFLIGGLAHDDEGLFTLSGVHSLPLLRMRLDDLP